MKTLYLDGQNATRVLRDGPALRVRRAGAADALFPLGRLGRVVVRGQVEWQTSALLACAEGGVPVAFLNAQGRLRARVVGDPPSPDVAGITSSFRVLLHGPGGRERYRDWVRAHLRRAVLGFVPWHARAGAIPSPKAVKRMMDQRLRGYVKMPELRRFDRQLHGLVNERADRCIRKAGLTLDPGELAKLAINPTRDFADIITVRALVPRERFIRRRWMQSRRRLECRARLEWRQAVQFAEEHGTWIDDCLEKLLENLHAHCLEARYGHAPQ